jgi:hypothetical protein
MPCFHSREDRGHEISPLKPEKWLGAPMERSIVSARFPEGALRIDFFEMWKDREFNYDISFLLGLHRRDQVGRELSEILRFLKIKASMFQRSVFGRIELLWNQIFDGRGKSSIDVSPSKGSIVSMAPKNWEILAVARTFVWKSTMIKWWHFS